MQISSIKTYNTYCQSFGKKNKKIPHINAANVVQHGCLTIGAASTIVVLLAIPVAIKNTAMQKPEPIETRTMVVNGEEIIVSAPYNYLQEIIEDASREASRDMSQSMIYHSLGVPALRTIPTANATRARRMSALLADKQNYQKQIAQSATDGEYVYFTLINEKPITVEQFEKIFDIKEGALFKISENNILQDIPTNEQELSAGTILMVKIEDIDIEDIELDYE